MKSTEVDFESFNCGNMALPKQPTADKTTFNAFEQFNGTSDKGTTTNKTTSPSNNEHTKKPLTFSTCLKSDLLEDVEGAINRSGAARTRRTQRQL
jgi:hypothetical protein